MKRLLLKILLVVTLSTTLAGTSLTAQPPAPAPSSVTPAAASIARGWSLLSQGRAAEALTAAEKAVETTPHNAAAISLAVEAAIASGGARAGLDRYERALGERQLDEPWLLRRIAEATLRESAGSAGDVALSSTKALAAGGDTAALAALEAAEPAGREARLRALASIGNDRAVQELAKSIDQPGAQTVAILDALGQSGSAEALPAISKQLTNPAPEVRGAAVDALGRLSDAQAAAQLVPLLEDQSSYVRTKAAAALYRLGDSSGLTMLQELAASDAPAGRLIAAEAMASRPDAAWLDMVRGLAGAPEPHIRVAAARLLAERDPELANRVLDQAMNDPNPSIREMASRARATSDTSLADLRRLLRSEDERTRGAAAARVLDLTA